MSKLRPGEESELGSPGYDLKHSFYRTFQENHLDFLCNPEEIVTYQELPKKEGMHNDSYSFEIKENSFIRGQTPIKEANLTPISLKFYNKMDYGLRFNEESSPGVENLKNGPEVPLSSMWQQEREHSNYEKLYDSFNGNKERTHGHYNYDLYNANNGLEFTNNRNKNAGGYQKDDIIDNNSNNKYMPNGKNQSIFCKEEAITEIEVRKREESGNIDFNLFKKPIPMFTRKNLGHNQAQMIIKGNEDTPNRSARGLRVLSMKVKEIVSQKEKVTYKEVAENLVEELDLKAEESQNGNKEEQNIKRRVYDALNVLIAANILKKKGKQVFSEECSTFPGLKIKKNTIEEKFSLEQSLEILRVTVEEKEKRLQEVLLKTLALKNLIKRNLKDQSLEEERVLFPFIALEMTSDPLKNSAEIISNKQKSFMKILSKEPFQIYGDIDILLKLELFKSGRSRIEELFPKELHQYFPPEVFALKLE